MDLIKSVGLPDIFTRICFAFFHLTRFGSVFPSSGIVQDRLIQEPLTGPGSFLGNQQAGYR